MATTYREGGKEEKHDKAPSDPFKRNPDGTVDSPASPPKPAPAPEPAKEPQAE
jgi:hypothetical protein